MRNYLVFGVIYLMLMSNLYFIDEKTGVSLSIERPKKGYLYISDKEITPFLTTVVIGGITIEVETDLEEVKFFIDGKLKYYGKTPYRWKWDEKAFGIHEIRVEGVNGESDEIKVFVINLQTSAEYVAIRFLSFIEKFNEKREEFYLTDAWIQAEEAKKAYIEGRYDEANMFLDNAFEALEEATKAEFSTSHSYISLKPTMEDEIPRTYNTAQEWYFIGGNGIDRDGNLISFWFSLAEDYANIFVGINNQVILKMYPTGLTREIDVGVDEISIRRDGVEIIIHPEGKRELFFSHSNMSLKISSIARGEALWYGREKGEMVKFNPTNHFGGFDEPIDIIGEMIYNGRTINFTGYGDYEHSWLDLPGNAMYYENWLCINTPIFSGVFLQTYTPKEIRCKTGRITIFNQTFRCDDFRIIDIDIPERYKVMGSFINGSFEFELKTYVRDGIHPFMTVEGILLKDGEKYELRGFAIGEVVRTLIDKPLEGNPGDLGSIHKPSIEELALEELFGIPRYNCWYCFTGRGDDERLYGLMGTFRLGKAYLTFKVLNEEIGFKMEMQSSKEFDGEKIIYSAGDTDNFIRYTIREDNYSVEAKHESFYINLTFHKKCSFWYNKGGIAKIYPDCFIAGIEETSIAEGFFIIDGERINVSGLAHSEHFFNSGDIVSKIMVYGNEWWIPFKFEEIQGILVVFGEYKDAGLIVEGEYIIPTNLSLWVEEGKIKVVADTTKGRLEIIHHIVDSIGNEYLAVSEGWFNKVELTDGYSWIEHIC